jgi:hypothetical protein
MQRDSMSHLSDPALLRDLASLVARDRTTTADLLAHLAEVDERKLYLPAAYPSMYSYGVGELHMSEDEALKRIRVARTARQFPAIFAALAGGRLNLTAVLLLTPHLTPDTAAGLLAAAEHKTKAEIELLLAERFPRPGTPARVREIAAPVAGGALAPQLAPEPVENALAPGHANHRSRVERLSPQSFEIQFTFRRSAHDKLRCAQELLGHQVPSGDIAAVFERALDELINRLGKRKFAGTTHPSRGGRPSANPRHIPAHVKRAAWQRDGGQCTFVSEAGRRCAARKLLEFDHIEEFARGGTASVAGIRLRCRAHNQYGAECTFGAGFMREKREEARRTLEMRRQVSEARARARAAAEEVIAPLRELGFGADEARRAAALCEAIPDTPLEQRVRRALTYFHPPRTFVQAATSPGSPP